MFLLWYGCGDLVSSLGFDDVFSLDELLVGDVVVVESFVGELEVMGLMFIKFGQLLLLCVDLLLIVYIDVFVWL